MLEIVFNNIQEDMAGMGMVLAEELGMVDMVLDRMPEQVSHQ